ncbi:hypothetical protein GCM10028803_43540 [Larkinella knui]
MRITDPEIEERAIGLVVDLQAVFDPLLQEPFKIIQRFDQPVTYGTLQRPKEVIPVFMPEFDGKGGGNPGDAFLAEILLEEHTGLK